MTFLCDDPSLPGDQSVLIEAEDWDEIEEICRQEGLDLIGIFLTEGWMEAPVQ